MAVLCPKVSAHSCKGSPHSGVTCCGAYYGTAYGTAKALVADVVPPQLRGTAYGAYSTVIGVLNLPASLIAGVLWDRFSPGAPFFFGAALAGLAALGLWLWQPDRHKVT